MTTADHAKWTPALIAARADAMKSGLKLKDPCLEDMERSLYSKEYIDLEDHTVYQDYDHTTGWMQLFLKLDFEDYLNLFTHSGDFKTLYLYLEIVAPHLTKLAMPVLNKKNLKSGHYWIMVVLAKLTKLHSLKFYGNQLNQFSFDGIKYLLKGVYNFVQNGGVLRKLEFISINFNAQMEEKLY